MPKESTKPAASAATAESQPVKTSSQQADASVGKKLSVVKIQLPRPMEILNLGSLNTISPRQGLDIQLDDANRFVYVRSADTRLCGSYLRIPYEVCVLTVKEEAEDA